MPYIKQEMRKSLKQPLKELIGTILEDEMLKKNQAGVLNYVITILLHKIILAEEISYDRINIAIGILECAKLEFYRKVASPYEDKKALDNGDIP